MSVMQHFTKPAQTTAHPAFRLPRLVNEVAKAHKALTAKIIHDRWFKLDYESIAQYLQFAHRAGWCGRDTLLTLAAEHSPLGLYKAMYDTLEVVNQTTDLSGAISVPRVLDNIVSSRMSPVSIQQIAAVSLRLGIFSPAEVMSLWRETSDPSSAFVYEFSDACSRFLGSVGTAPNTMCGTTTPTLFMAYVSEDYEGVSVIFEPDMARWPLKIPMGDDNSSIMLRDALMLVMDTLHILGMHATSPSDFWHGNCFIEEDIGLLEEILPPESTAADVLNHFTLIGREVALDVAPELKDADLSELLKNEKVLMELDAAFPCLMSLAAHTYGGPTLMEQVEQWASLAAVLMNKQHWLSQRHLPDLSVCETDDERASIAIHHCQDTLTALSSQLASTHPQTVAAITALVEWMAAIANDRIDIAALLPSDVDGLYFGQSFLIIPEAYGDEPPWLSLAKDMTFERIDVEANQCGIQQLTMPLDPDGEAEPLYQGITLSQRYGELGVLLSTLYSAQQGENLV